MRGRKRYHYKEWTTDMNHKAYPGFWHRCLYMETNECAVMIHVYGWEKMERGGYQWNVPPRTPMDSRVKMKFRTLGGTITPVDDSVPPDFAGEWIGRLMRTKNRNREIVRIEQEAVALCEMLYDEDDED